MNANPPRLYAANCDRIGNCIGRRATRNIDRLQIARDGATVAVDLSNLVKSDAQDAEWKAAVNAV